MAGTVDYYSEHLKLHQAYGHAEKSHVTYSVIEAGEWTACTPCQREHSRFSSEGRGWWLPPPSLRAGPCSHHRLASWRGLRPEVWREWNKLNTKIYISYKYIYDKYLINEDYNCFIHFLKEKKVQLPNPVVLMSTNINQTVVFKQRTQWNLFYRQIHFTLAYTDLNDSNNCSRMWDNRKPFLKLKALTEQQIAK